MSLSQLPVDTLDQWGVDASWFTLPGKPDDQHWIPVSGGADSSALAILMHLMYPEVPFKLLFTDTLAEEPEIYTTLDKLEAFLGVQIIRLKPELGLQIPFFMIKQSNDMISLIDGHDQRL